MSKFKLITHSKYKNNYEKRLTGSIISIRGELDNIGYDESILLLYTLKTDCGQIINNIYADEIKPEGKL